MSFTEWVVLQRLAQTKTRVISKVLILVSEIQQALYPKNSMHPSY